MKNWEINFRFFLSLYFLPGVSGSAASAVTLGPLVLGDDELVYTVVTGGEEDLDITALIENEGLAGRPVSIISFNSDCGSATALATGSQPICTALDGVVEDHMLVGPAASSGVSDVVAMAEVSATLIVWFEFA